MLMRPDTRVPRHSHLRVGVIVAFAIALLALFAIPLATASPAAAASPAVLLSDDGVHFAPTYSGSLFDDTALMVPLASQTGRFWVKNGSAEPAFLRISVGGVSGGGSPFSGALTLTASTPTLNGSPIAVDAASPCYVLTQGQVLAPGAVVRVDAALALGNLNGTTGQSASVDFDIQVGLSSAATGSLPPTSCLTTGGTVPGTPGGGGGGGGTGGHGGGGTGTGGGSDPSASGSATGGYDAPTTPDGSAFTGGEASVGILEPNTGRFFQEWWVMAWVFGAIAGGGLCALLARRRHNEQEEVTTWGDVALSGRRAWSTTSGWA